MPTELSRLYEERGKRETVRKSEKQGRYNNKIIKQTRK
jgi:hypothetical protein